MSDEEYSIETGKRPEEAQAKSAIGLRQSRWWLRAPESSHPPPTQPSLLRFLSLSIPVFQVHRHTEYN